MNPSLLTASGQVLSAGGRRLCVAAEYSAYALDVDAIAWLNAAGIANDANTFYDTGAYRRSGAQIWAAGDQRVKNLKLAGVWPLLAGDWPLAGDSPAAHRINAVAPGAPAALLLDTNNPAPLFSGGFSGRGGGWFDLGIRPADLPQDNVAISIYSRVQVDALQMPLGAADANLSTSLYLFPSFSSLNYSRLNQADSQPISNAYSLGMQLGARTATGRTYYNRSTKVGEDAVPSLAPSTATFYAGACNVAGEAMYRAASYTLGAWQVWKAAPTQDQITAFNQIEEAWQTALGRNV